MKRLPIGIEDYAEATKSFYIDKTEIIKDIIDFFFGRSVLVCRPRRFGKSLNLSMIDYFFNREKDSTSLFLDKKIASYGEKYLAFCGRYPLIHINMKSVYASTAEDLLRSAIEEISREYCKFSFLLESNKLLETEKESFRAIMERRLPHVDSYATALLNLSHFLEEHFGEKTIILIDEYDTPLERAFQHGYYDTIIPFFRKLYSSCLKGNPDLNFAFLTGVLDIRKDPSFSDLNNLSVFSVIDDELSEYFGFTSEEVQDAIDHFQMDVDVREIERWYGGYGKAKMMNPWSVLNFISKETFGPYWVNTGSNQSVADIIEKIPDAEAELNRLVGNESVSFPLRIPITYKDARSNSNALFSYLVQSGYLSAKRTDYYGNCMLYIPNEEVRIAFSEEIIARSTQKPSLEAAYLVRKALLTGDVDSLSKSLNDYVLTSFSYFDLTKEKEVQAMFAGLLSVLFGDYIVKCEAIVTKGRSDILLMPKSKGLIGVVIEIKRNKGKLGPARLSDLAEKAIQQALDKEYDQDLWKMGCKEVLIYGIVFDDRSHAFSLKRKSKE